MTDLKHRMRGMPATGLLLLAICAGLPLGACTTSHKQALEAPQESPETIASELSSSPFDKDGMSEASLFKLLVAEFAGQRGKLGIALDNYLALARSSTDPQLAERAARIAVFAHDDVRALEAAEIWRHLQPQSLEARQILAVMYIRTGNLAAARDELEYILGSPQGTRTQKLRMIASFLGREQDKAAAMKVMEDLLETRKDDPEALFAFALLAVRAGQLDKADDAMARAMQQSPGNLNLALAYFGILQKQGHRQAAFNWIKGLLDQRPDSFELRMVFARLLADLQRYDEARAEFNALAAIAPENADVHYALGLLNLQANHLDEARVHFIHLINIGARKDTAKYYLGQIAEAHRLLEAALEWYDSVREGEHVFHARLQAISILAQQKRYTQAMSRLRQIRAEDASQRLQLIRAQADLLTQQGRHGEALEVYNQALAEHEDADLLYSRAMLAEKMGRLDILEADLRRVIEMQPDNAQALNALGYTLADRTDRYREAHELIARALKLKPNDFYILDSMGWVLYRLGRLDEAISYLQRARAIRNDPEVSAHLGEVLWVKGDKQAAKAVWEGALQESPDDARLQRLINKFTP